MEDLFRIIEISEIENIIFATTEINSNHKIFNGHFPKNPVVPGVITVNLIKKILEKNFNKKLNLSESKQIKFLSVIKPELVEKLKVKINYSLTDNGIAAKSEISDESSIYFKANSFYVNY